MNLAENLKNVDIKPENKLELKIEVSEFDSTQTYLTNEEELDNKMLTYIEREVRNSYEYKSYINYLKEELDLTQCALLPSIDTKITPVSLEFHHFPLSLYDISSIVGKSLLDGLKTDESVSCFDIAEKVVEEHYNNSIGLVPLTETMHQMAHTGSIFIPMDKINGNYKEFLAEYNKFIEPTITDKINTIEEYNKSETAKNYNREKLQKRIVNYDITYIEEGGSKDAI